MRDLKVCPRLRRYPRWTYLSVFVLRAGAIFLKKTSDEKLKTFVMHSFTKKSNNFIELSNFCRNVETKVRENERRLSKGPTI